MKNVVALQKTEDGHIYCKEITDVGLRYLEDTEGKPDIYWEEGGTILLDELEEILDKER